MSQHYRIVLISEAISPITHMRGVEGNEAIIAREEIDTPSGKRFVPSLSGNALRHRLIRRPGALWLIDQLGLKGKLSLKQLNFLLHGGNLTDSTGREDTSRIAEMQELFPLLRLLGGSLPDQILEGSLLMWHGMLLCEENRPFLEACLPDGYGPLPVGLKPAEHFVETYQYTRGDGKRLVEMYDQSTRDPDDKSNLMIFAGQKVIRGAQFLHGLDLRRASIVELGCLLHSLNLWQEQGGTIGGMASKGHGRLQTAILGSDGWEDGVTPDRAVEAYLGHVEANKTRCVDWLNRVFAKKEEKPAKGKKAAKLAAETEDQGGIFGA